MKTYSFHSLVLSTLFILVHQTAVQGENFAPAVSYEVGPSPAYVTGADANGDGRTDLLVSANIGDSTLTILTNNGSGVFGSNDTLSVGSSPFCVAAADVNGDGRIELFTANAGENSLTVLTNNGSGRFGSNATLVVGEYPVYVAVADVNGDGKLDLISANFRSDGYGNTLTIFTNNGSGRFVYSATPVVGQGPFALVAADVNNDRKIDLISANANGNSLTVLTNNGSGVFGYNDTLTVGTYPQSVAAADVNGDRKLDLISANTSSGTLTILTNNGSGTFGWHATLSTGSGEQSYPASVVAADVNNDDKMDLVSANYGDNTLTVFANNGAGSFGVNATLEVGQGPYSVAVVHINGDGRSDLVSANLSGSTLSLLPNIGPLFLPELVINLAAPDIAVISWPLSATGFVLQQNSDLTTTNWPDYSGSLSTNATTISATISPVTGNRYYRLFHP
jgi:hypothetical protein